MSTLWLRNIDGVSRLIPASLTRHAPRVGRSLEEVVIIRPGGLGDLVLLTRAGILAKFDLREALWVIEKRNAPWAEFLNLRHLCYDEPRSFSRILFGYYVARAVINSEQTYGLSTLAADRFCRPDGQLLGFDSNSCASHYDLAVPYDFAENELSCFLRLLGQGQLPIKADAESVVPPATVPVRSFRAIVALAGLQESYKRLSVEQWQAIVRRALRAEGEVLVVGHPIDRPFSERVCSAFDGAVVNDTGALSFESVVECIRATQRLYTVDGGLMHVADFFGVPCDVVFTSGLQSKWGPTSSASVVLAPSQLDADG